MASTVSLLEQVRSGAISRSFKIGRDRTWERLLHFDTGSNVSQGLLPPNQRYNAPRTVYSMTKCLPLSAEGVVGIFSTGAPLSRESFELGLQALSSLGLRTKCPLDPTRFAADSPRPLTSAPLQERLSSLGALVADPEVEILLAARGGYGTLEILPFIDFDRVRESRKLIIGYSDITPLLLAVSACSGIPTIHGATLGCEFAEAEASPEARVSVEELLEVVCNPHYRVKLSGEILRGGEGEGTLMGGNLAMLLTLFGTPWEPDLRGSIVFLEDVTEPPFRIRRALVQLKLAGKLDKLAGLIFGRFAGCESPGAPSVRTVLEESILDLFAESSFPILLTDSFGHAGRNVPLPLGCRAAIRGDALTVLESPIAGDAR